MDKELNKFFEDEDTSIMIIAAVRYSMHRQTYVAHASQDWIKKYYTKFPSYALNIITRDLIEALQNDECGHPKIDKPGWVNLCEFLFNKLTPENKQFVLNSIDKSKPIPFKIT